jgi:hypothetical protein
MRSAELGGISDCLPVAGGEVEVGARRPCLASFADFISQGHGSILEAAHDTIAMIWAAFRALRRR